MRNTVFNYLLNPHVPTRVLSHVKTCKIGFKEVLPFSQLMNVPIKNSAVRGSGRLHNQFTVETCLKTGKRRLFDKASYRSFG